MADFLTYFLIAGKAVRPIDLGVTCYCLTIDLKGDIYITDNRQTCSKYAHDRFYDPEARKHLERFTRMWFQELLPDSPEIR